MYTLNTERLIQAPADIIWDVISDVERYADYASNLSKAIKTSDGQTPTRRCYDTQGRSWDEACVLWKEGEVYSYVVDTSAPDYPYPFSQLKGTWGIKQQANGNCVWMRFDYTPKPPLILGWLVHKSVQRMFGSVVDDLMGNWAAEIMKRTGQRKHQTTMHDRVRIANG